MTHKFHLYIFTDTAKSFFIYNDQFSSYFILKNVGKYYTEQLDYICRKIIIFSYSTLTWLQFRRNLHQLMLFVIYLFTYFNKTHKIWSHAVHLQ